MTSVNILEIVAILLLLINHSNTLLCKEKANPSVGDLCLDWNTTLQGVPLLLVYYTDSLDQPPKWGTICDDKVDETALTTMCQQLGYDIDAKPEYIWGHNDVEPWFSKVMCGSQTTQNILRCPFIRANNHDCSKIYLPCGPDNSWNMVPNKGYIGQVLLLHPENTAPGQLAAGYQVSFGLVLIYMHVDGSDDTWGVITQNKTQPFTRNAADSVCRQMGYTEANPNHITTVKNSNTSYLHLYDNAWLTSNNTRDCMDSSEPCFSCCFTRPTHLCSLGTCLFEDSIVLQCVFDLNKEDMKYYSEGDKELCQISDFRKPNSCAGPPYESITFSLVGVSSVLLLIIIIAILVVLVYCCCYKGRRPMGNPEQQPLLPNNLDQRQN